MLCFVSLQCFFHFPRAGPQCFGGVTLFDNSLLSALIVFFVCLVGFFPAWQIRCFFLPLQTPRQNLFLESLLCMHSFSLQEKGMKTLVRVILKKVFSSPGWGENKFVTEESKESVRKTALWWMVRRRQLQATYQTLHGEDFTHTHTHSTIYAYMLKTLAMWDNLEFLFLRIHSSQNPVKPPLLGILINILYRKYTHSPTDTHRLQQTGSLMLARMRRSQVRCTRSSSTQKARASLSVQVWLHTLTLVPTNEGTVAATLLVFFFKGVPEPQKGGAVMWRDRFRSLTHCRGRL